MNSALENTTYLTKPFIDRVGEILKSSLPKSNYEELNFILNYQLENNGHMIRPTLIFLTAKCLLGDINVETLNKLAYFAASVELLHNASLIHDDVLDNEELRRGKPSMFKKYGEKNAILTGNVYYISSFKLTMKTLDSFQLETLADTAGDMCFGELLQNDFNHKSLDKAQYFEVIKKKTASLMRISCLNAANICGSDTETQSDCAKLGEEIGMLYQLIDDLKDADANISENIDYQNEAENYFNSCMKILDSFPKKEFVNIFKGFVSLIKP